MKTQNEVIEVRADHKAVAAKVGSIANILLSNIDHPTDDQIGRAVDKAMNCLQNEMAYSEVSNVFKSVVAQIKTNVANESR